jgi:hypothetical protein
MEELKAQQLWLSWKVAEHVLEEESHLRTEARETRVPTPSPHVPRTPSQPPLVNPTPPTTTPGSKSPTHELLGEQAATKPGTLVME